MRKIKFILITVLSVCLLSGCGKTDNYPYIDEYGATGWIWDNTRIFVKDVEPGLKGYEIIEEDNKVKVILTYDKR